MDEVGRTGRDTQRQFWPKKQTFKTSATNQHQSKAPSNNSIHYATGKLRAGLVESTHLDFITQHKANWQCFRSSLWMLLIATETHCIAIERVQIHRSGYYCVPNERLCRLIYTACKYFSKPLSASNSATASLACWPWTSRQITFICSVVLRLQWHMMLTGVQQRYLLKYMSFWRASATRGW